MKMIFLAFIFLSPHAFATLEPVTLTSQDSFPAPRWMYGVGAAPTKGSEKDASFALVKVKQAQVEGDFATCAEDARAARSKAKSLQGWLAVVELECASKVKPTSKSATALSHAVDDVSKHADWFVLGPQAPRLKTAFALGLVRLIDQDLKANRSRAWKSIERVDEFSSLMDDKTKAQAWRAAGDLSVTQQKLDAARDFYHRSLALSESSDTRERLAAVERQLNPVVNSGVNSAVLKPGPKIRLLPDEEPVDGQSLLSPIESNPISEAIPEELDLVDRATMALKSGDIVVAMDDAVQLIQKFPGGSRAKWAQDRVLDTLANFADKTDVKYQDIHDQVLDRIQKVDADRLTEWARVCYNRAQFQDAFLLSKKALMTVDGARRTKTLELASQSAIAVDAWDVARTSLEELIDKSAGQPASREALFRLGLLNYRLQKFAESITNFERLLALPQAENLELGARYWLWRSLQKTKSERAPQAADELMTKFPFSYYGLRARLEQGNGTLEWKPVTSDLSKTPKKGPKKIPEKVESVMWLTATDKMAWEKAQILLKSGWLDEAQSELQELPAPVTASDKAVRALLWAAAGGYGAASRLANDAWDEKSEYRRAPFTDAVFPRDFSDFIEANAKKRAIDRDLVRGLIKQESAYNPKAVSSSNADGLMQMIPPTAREIAQDLHLGALKLPDDMFVPKRNIEMGTYYLSRQVSHYSGYVPLAVASYNAGPGRIDRWLRTRPSLKTLSSTKSSAADDEIWIDEIPYSETRFYVKAILRNIMLYRLLDQGRVVMPDPIWSQANSPSH